MSPDALSANNLLFLSWGFLLGYWLRVILSHRRDVREAAVRLEAFQKVRADIEARHSIARHRGPG